MLDLTFAALGDPTRRAIVARLANSDGLPVGVLAEAFPVSLPAVIKHIDVLCDAGLVTRTRTGRNVTCRLASDPMADAMAWLERHAGFWSARMDALAHLVETPNRSAIPMTIKNVLAGVAVSHLSPAIAWYERLIGRAPDQQPMPGLAEFHFGQGGWLQLFEDGERAGRSSVTLTVASLEDEINRLKALDVATSSRTQSDYVDTAIVTDPDGNQVVLAEAKSAINAAAS